MKGLKRIFSTVLLVCFGIAAFGGCTLEGTRALSKEEVLRSVKEDFSIVIETEFAEFKITRSNELKLLYYATTDEKLAANGDLKDGIQVIYIKTGDGGHKFVYYVPHLKNNIYVNNIRTKSTAKDGITVSDYPFPHTVDDIYEKTQSVADSTLKEKLSGNFYKNFTDLASFYSIVKSQSIRYVFDDEYFFVFGASPKTYMIIFQDELYAIENQRCIYPKDMSIAEMIILFDND